LILAVIYICETLDAALKYFQDQKILKFKVIGAGNQIQTATLQVR
jgi:hypothetical protein